MMIGVVKKVVFIKGLLNLPWTPGRGQYDAKGEKGSLDYSTWTGLQVRVFRNRPPHTTHHKNAKLEKGGR